MPRFHFAKALYSRLKSKFRLGSYFLSRANATQKRIAHVLRQYMCLPLLHHFHVHKEVQRLEAELRQLVRDIGKADARRCNLFHNYVVTYWCKLIGPVSFSVSTLADTTNNRLERLVAFSHP